MLNKIKQSEWEENYQRFLSQFQTPPALKLVSFHPVQLPVVISEAHVQMRSVQDYSVLSLLILRLFDAGITAPEAIQSICGLSAETVRIYINKEKYILAHIDPLTNQLTDVGRETLKANENLQDGKARHCQYFDSVLRVHVDPLTASLIPQYLEWEQADNVQPNQEAGDFLLPRASASVDDTFRKELRDRLLKDINSRKDEYVSLDAVQNGDILNSVTAFRPIGIFYRWGYLAKFEGMKAPMIVLSGKISVDRVNAKSNAAGVKERYVAMPIALSESDKAYLSRYGIFFEKVLRRDDSCFEELIRETQNMVLMLPNTHRAAAQDDRDPPKSEAPVVPDPVEPESDGKYENVDTDGAAANGKSETSDDDLFGGGDNFDWDASDENETGEEIFGNKDSLDDLFGGGDTFDWEPTDVKVRNKETFDNKASDKECWWL